MVTDSNGIVSITCDRCQDFTSISAAKDVAYEEFYKLGYTLEMSSKYPNKCKHCTKYLTLQRVDRLKMKK